MHSQPSRRPKAVRRLAERWDHMPAQPSHTRVHACRQGRPSTSQPTNSLSTAYPADLRARGQDPRRAPTYGAHEHPIREQDGRRDPPDVSRTVLRGRLHGAWCGAARTAPRVRPEKGRQTEGRLSASTSATAPTSARSSRDGGGVRYTNGHWRGLDAVWYIELELDSLILRRRAAMRHPMRGWARGERTTVRYRGRQGRLVTRRSRDRDFFRRHGRCAQSDSGPDTYRCGISEREGCFS